MSLSEEPGIPKSGGLDLFFFSEIKELIRKPDDKFRSSPPGLGLAGAESKPSAWRFPMRASHSGRLGEIRVAIRRPEFQRPFAVPKNSYFQKQYLDKGDFREYSKAVGLKQRPPADSPRTLRFAGGETKPTCKALINLDSRT
jgi:hypothetical protein